MTDLLYKDEVYNIVGAAMEVHGELGPEFWEAVYQEALAIEFELRNIPFIEQLQLNLEYKTRSLKRKYIPDFLCYQEIVVEIKAQNRCGENEEAQLINALKAANKRVGVLINFGEHSLFWRRYVN
jgi:GxxExxY protein